MIAPSAKSNEIAIDSSRQRVVLRLHCCKVHQLDLKFFRISASYFNIFIVFRIPEDNFIFDWRANERQAVGRPNSVIYFLILFLDIATYGIG